ncbi:MAG TPA: MgtC/SapB family protein [Actinomycetota bacterium]|nr:MgtC/SapB family protein [Actinomycetota bacterium]
MATDLPSQLDLILRLLLAATLAGLLGGERELTEQPAGFRTHILVGLGAALFAVISAYGFQSVVGTSPRQVRADPTRIASQIVVGIGFLGGGAIVKYGASIRGLTTAASLWVTAAVGTAIGLGALLLGFVTTVITLVALVGLRPLRRILRRRAAARDEFLIEGDRSIDIQDLVSRVQRAGAQIMEVRMSDEGNERRLHLVVQPPADKNGSSLVAVIAGTPNVRNVDWLG